MEAILNIFTEYGPTALAVIGAIYTCIRTIVAATKTPVVPGTKLVNAPAMKAEHPIVGLLASLFAIDTTKGRTAEASTVKKGSSNLGILIAMGLILGLTGCAGTSTSFTPWGTDTYNQPANVSEIKTDGTQKAVYQGIGGTNAKIDADGVWFMTPGTGSTLAKDGVYAYFPGDMTAEDIAYDGSKFTASKLTISYSAPLKVQADAFTVAAETIQGMTQIEATKQIAIWVEVGKITKTVADALLKYLVPTLPTVPVPIAAPVDAPTMLDALKPGA